MLQPASDKDLIFSRVVYKGVTACAVVRMIFSKQTFVAVGGRSSGQGQVCIAIYRFHLRDVLGPVLGVILNDAQGVNPEVLYAQSPCHFDGVLKREWKLLYWYSLSVFFDIRSQCYVAILSIAPAVAEAYIFPVKLSGISHLDQLHRVVAQAAVDIDEARGCILF